LLDRISLKRQKQIDSIQASLDALASHGVKAKDTHAMLLLVLAGLFFLATLLLIVITIIFVLLIIH
jgi:hypothetical protein